jgi:hypothetical protein
MELPMTEESLLKMAALEENGIVSVGGLICHVEATTGKSAAFIHDQGKQSTTMPANLPSNTNDLVTR